MMYYYVPKRRRPIYSYRLSIVHFWALIASTCGPARTTCSTALPDWAQTLHGVLADSCWRPLGGAINGIMPVGRGA